MAITLGTNIPSYNARISLDSVTKSLSSTMEKLSSGLKINRAGDDAAGLVISENMEALIRGSKQAQANIDTATSFLTMNRFG
jgi:flagellin